MHIISGLNGILEAEKCISWKDIYPKVFTTTTTGFRRSGNFLTLFPSRHGDKTAVVRGSKRPSDPTKYKLEQQGGKEH